MRSASLRAIRRPAPRRQRRRRRGAPQAHRFRHHPARAHRLRWMRGRSLARAACRSAMSTTFCRPLLRNGLHEGCCGGPRACRASRKLRPRRCGGCTGPWTATWAQQRRRGPCPAPSTARGSCSAGLWRSRSGRAGRTTMLQRAACSTRNGRTQACRTTHRQAPAPARVVSMDTRRKGVARARSRALAPSLTRRRSASPQLTCCTARPTQRQAHPPAARRRAAPSTTPSATAPAS